MLAFAAAWPSAAAAAELSVSLEGLRNANGRVHVCLTRNPGHFPDCAGDPEALRRTLPARQAGHFALDAPPGVYALSIVHDENGNGRLDTRLMIPCEGFGFSRNPRIRFGAPRFSETRFAISGERVAQTVTIKYIL